MTKVLVIGYGNTLRGDDGVGPGVAAAVAGWRGLRALAVHQLTPELAEPIAAADAVVFVDAYTAHPGDMLRVEAVQPGGTLESVGHSCDPRTLMAIAGAVYGVQPPAWLLGVPGVDFEPRNDGRLSPTAAAGLRDALRWIAEFPGITAIAKVGHGGGVPAI